MDWSQPRRLYVAEFSNGVVKVGITKSSALHKQRALTASQGTRPISFHIGEKHECGFWGEQELIRRMRRIGNTFKGREWFTGVRFNAARLLMQQVTRMAYAVQADEQQAA